MQEENKISNNGNDNIFIQNVNSSTIHINQINFSDLIKLFTELPLHFNQELTPIPKIEKNKLIGRIDLVNEINNSVKINRITLLKGVGGIGKSTIAKQYINQFKDEFQHMSLV